MVHSGTGMTRIILGSFLVAFPLLFYWVVASSLPVLTEAAREFLLPLSWASLGLMITGVGYVVAGLWRLMTEERVRLEALGALPSGLRSLTAHLLWQKNYFRIMILSGLTYGVFYAFLSGTLVYQPWFTFSATYSVDIPSMDVILAYGPPGQIPIFVVYLTEHIGALIIPLNVLLLVAVSGLVGWNVVLTVHAYRSRPQGTRGTWFAGLGATVGLFTGCPTCAGLFFASVVGGAAAVSTAAALASLQTLLIAASIPVLIVTPHLTYRGLVKPFIEGCGVTRSRELSCGK